VGAQGRIVVIGALALAACGSHKSRAHDAAVEAESVEDADDGQLFTVPGFDPEIHYAAVQEAEFPVRQNVMYVDEEFTATRLRVTNTRSDRVGIDVGTYWLARLPGYQYPYPEEGCLPEWPFLIVVPHDEVVVGAGESVELNPSHMFYLGNAERPWPQPSSGLRWELEVQDASNEEALVHLAYAIGDAKELDFAFAIAGGCSPEPWLTDALLAGKSAADLARVEAMFRDAGLPAAPVFAAARKKRDDLVAQLRDELGTFRATHSFEGLRM
jgi:hypothetical protein